MNSLSICSMKRRKRLFFLVVLTASLLIFFLTLLENRWNVQKRQFVRLTLKQSFSMSLDNVKSQQWISVPEGGENDPWSLSVYDVFYDSRINKVVVFMASQISDLLEKQGEFMYEYICIYFDQSGFLMDTVSGYFYTSYMLYCNVTDSAKLPTFVSILRNDSLSVPNWMSPVRRIPPPAPQASIGKLALCVGIIFGNQPWLTLLQFFEFHRSQGVEKFYVFYFDLHSPTTRKIFAFYMKIYPDLLELIEWSPKTSFCVHYWCQLLRDNYCLYANMYKYKYVGFVDYDELLYSVDENVSLVQLLEQFDRPYIGSFTFRARWQQTLRDESPFWDRVDEYNLETVVRTYLPIVRYNNVSTLASELYSPKVVVKPEFVYRKWIHFVREHVAGSFYFFFNESQAHLAHFKIRSRWGIYADHADSIVNFTIIDPNAIRQKPLVSNLLTQVENVVKRIKTEV